MVTLNKQDNTQTQRALDFNSSEAMSQHVEAD